MKLYTMTNKDYTTTLHWIAKFTASFIITLIIWVIAYYLIYKI